MARSFIVTESVVDLRNAPEITFQHDYSHQSGRESQLLFGEHLTLLEEKGEWLKVGALEQLRYTSDLGWHPYPGWVHCSEVVEARLAPATHVVCTPGAYSYGTLLNPLHHQAKGIRPLPQAPSRAQIVEDAHLFLNFPYLWGGRASSIPNAIASVDCSGLINLLYRAQGISIPRDAHDQYLVSKPVHSLLPGDPLYLAKETRINHVILKIDDTTYIEAPETGKQVRLLKWGPDIWEEGGKIHFKDRTHSYTPYPRCFFA